MPLHYYLQSAERHLLLLINGDEKEDHASAIAWNIAGFVWTKERLMFGALPEYYNTVGSDRFWTGQEYDEWFDIWEETEIDYKEWIKSNEN